VGSIQNVSRRVTVIARSIVVLVGLAIGGGMRGDGECWIC